jgi:hypothetical protein
MKGTGKGHTVETERSQEPVISTSRLTKTFGTLTVVSDLNLEVLAALRNAAVGLLHRRRWPNRAAALRANAWAGPAAVLGLLGLKLCMALPTASGSFNYQER